MRLPITFETQHFLIHPLRQIDMARHDKIMQDVFEILSDEDATEFIPEKRLKTINEAQDLMLGVVLSYQYKRSYTHFITIKDISKVIGVINLISPETIKESYQGLPEYNWMVEYYIHRLAWDRGIMSEILPIFKTLVLAQGINKLGAICKQQNYASIKVLEKSGFSKKYRADYIQDYYEAKIENE